VLVPMEKVAEVRNGKKTVTSRKLYPGYVFIDMALLDENQKLIREALVFHPDTQGIIGFVGGERPTPTPPRRSSRSSADRGFGGYRAAEGELSMWARR
jgi:transcription termination/antitermination protein NusG